MSEPNHNDPGVAEQQVFDDSLVKPQESAEEVVENTAAESTEPVETQGFAEQASAPQSNGQANAYTQPAQAPNQYAYGQSAYQAYDPNVHYAYGVPPQGYYPAQGAGAPKSKVAAGVFGILLGSLGIHKFYLGYTVPGLIMLLATVLTLGVVGIVMGIIGLVEGIIYLTMSDADFYRTYVLGKKEWF